MLGVKTVGRVETTPLPWANFSCQDEARTNFSIIEEAACMACTYHATRPNLELKTELKLLLATQDAACMACTYIEVPSNMA